MIKQIAPHRAEHEAGEVRDDAGEQGDHSHRHGLVVFRVREILDAQGQHHQVRKAHEHPADQRPPEQRVVAHKTHRTERMRAAVGENRLRRASREAEARHRERSTEDQKQPAILVDVPVQGVSRKLAESSGHGDADHDRPREETSTFPLRVIVLIHLGQQRDHRGRRRHADHAPDDEDEQRGNRRGQQKAHGSESENSRRSTAGGPAGRGDEMNGERRKEKAEAACAGHDALGHGPRGELLDGDGQEKGAARRFNDASRGGSPQFVEVGDSRPAGSRTI